MKSVHEGANKKELCTSFALNFATLRFKVWFIHCKLSIGLMLNLTLGVAQPGFTKCQFSISPMLMLNLALVEPKKYYSVIDAVSLSVYTVVYGELTMALQFISDNSIVDQDPVLVTLYYFFPSSKFII
jgi:hypothetical protein